MRGCKEETEEESFLRKNERFSRIAEVYFDNENLRFENDAMTRKCIELENQILEMSFRVHELQNRIKNGMNKCICKVYLSGETLMGKKNKKKCEGGDADSNEIETNLTKMGFEDFDIVC